MYLRRVKISKSLLVALRKTLLERVLALLCDLIYFSNFQRYSRHAKTVAGVFSLLNDFRLSKNKASLGFINPLIYSTAKSGFTDIKSGSNPGCGTAGKAVSYLKLKQADGLIRVHRWYRMGSSEYIFYPRRLPF